MLSFWDESGAKYTRDTSSSNKTGLDHTKEILKNKVFLSDYTPRTSLLTGGDFLDSSAIRVPQLGCRK